MESLTTPKQIIDAFQEHKSEPFLRVKTTQEKQHNTQLVQFEYWTPTGYKQLNPVALTTIINTNIAAATKAKYSFQLSRQGNFDAGVASCQAYKILCDEVKKLFPTATVGYTDKLPDKKLEEPVYRIKIYPQTSVSVKQDHSQYTPEFGIKYFHVGNAVKAICNFGLINCAQGQFGMFRARNLTVFVNKNTSHGTELDEDETAALGDQFEF